MEVRAGVWWLSVACTACTQVLDFDGTSSSRAPSDAGMDASPGDAGQAEAGADASAGFCASLGAGVRFCDDFDSEGVSFERWTQTFELRGAVSIDSAQFVSPSWSFLASSEVAEPSDAGAAEPASATALLALEDAAQRPVAITVSFDFGIDAHDGTDGSWATFLRFIYDGADHDVLLDFDLVASQGDELALYLDEWRVPSADGGTEGSYDSVPGADLSPLAWHHVRLRVVLNEPSGFDNSFALTLDGEPRLARQLRVQTSSGTPVIDLGLVNVPGDAEAPWQVRFDNFVVEVEEL
jgi:hypothetical protein